VVADRPSTCRAPRPGARGRRAARRRRGARHPGDAFERARGTTRSSGTCAGFYPVLTEFNTVRDEVTTNRRRHHGRARSERLRRRGPRRPIADADAPAATPPARRVGALVVPAARGPGVLLAAPATDVHWEHHPRTSGSCSRAR
jgi:hypothetical protein